MNAATTTCDPSATAAPRRACTLCGASARHDGRARSMVRRVAAALSPRRPRRSRATFADAYDALRRVDQRLLVDIGIRPEQLTAFARAATTDPRRREVAAHACAGERR